MPITPRHQQIKHVTHPRPRNLLIGTSFTTVSCLSMNCYGTVSTINIFDTERSDLFRHLMNYHICPE